MTDGFKILAHQIKNRTFGTTTEKFGQKKPVFLQNFQRKIQRRFQQGRGPQMVCCPMASGISGHVAHYPVSRAANSISHLGHHRIISHIADKNISINDVFRIKQIDTNKLCLADSQFCADRGDLKLAPGRTAKINDSHAGLEKLIAVINLCQLDRRA